jgi:hypothetical protein
MQFSLFRLLLATTVFAAVLGLTQLMHLGLAGSVMAATGLAGIALLRGNKGLRMSDRVAGFSPRRVAWATAMLSWALVPAHFFVSCGASGGIFFSDHALLVIADGREKAGKKVSGTVYLY